MSCMTTVSTSIVFNGEALNPIYPSRGIRQGDPLSPYLFILCMDFLGQLIEEKCNANLWNLVKALKVGLPFPTCSLRMTWSFSLEQTMLIVPPSKMFWMSLATCRGK